MKKAIVGVMGCLFMLLCSGSAYAGVFAQGGGESRIITSVSPRQMLNDADQTVTLSGKFSKKQGGGRRVVLSADRLPTPFSARVIQWSRSQIKVVIPRSVQAGRYHIFLEKSFRDHGRLKWRTISNQRVITVLSSRARPLSVVHVPNEAQMCANKVQIGLSGGPFQDGTQVELSPPARFQTATARMVGPNTLSAMVSICWLQNTSRNKRLRLIYPGGGQSDWVEIGAFGSADRNLHTVRELGTE